MRKSIVIVILFCVYHGNAQYTPLDHLLSQDKYSILSFGAGIEFGSNSLNYPFSNAFYNSNFLTSDIKSTAIEELKSKNHLGLLAGANFNFISKYKSHFGLKNTCLSVIMENKAWAESGFSKDVFALYFTGNASYENKTAQLAPFELNLIHYSAIKIGFSKKMNKLDLGVSAGLALGHKASHIILHSGTLYTAPFGEYLNLDANLVAEENEINKSKITNINGQGTVFGVQLRYKIKDQEDLSIAFENFGKINWNENSQRSIIDTTYKFEGIVVQNLFDSIYFDIKSEDELKNDFLKKEKGINLSTKLPYQIIIRHRHSFFENKVNTGIKLQYLNSKNYNLLVEGNIDFRVLKILRVGGVIGTGGYSDFNLGLYGRLNLFNSFEIAAHYSSLFNTLNKNAALNKLAGIKISYLY